MSDTSPPLTRLEAAVAELLEASGQLLRRLRMESNPATLTWPQIAALSRLAKNGPMTTANLAREEAVKPQSMGATLAPLERDGLIERRPHPIDGRQFLFDLTEKGVSTRRTNTHLKREWLSAAMSTLDETDQQTLIKASGLVKRLAGL